MSLMDGSAKYSSVPTGTMLVKTLLVVVAILLGVVIGQVAGILAFAGGAPISTSFVSGGVALGATTTLVLVIENYLGLLR